MTSTKSVTSNQPVKQCIQYDAESYKALTNRQLMLVLEVLRYRPSIKNSGLKVAIIDPQSQKTINVNRPAIYPDRAFDVNNGDSPMRFYIALDKHLKWLGYTESCFHIAFEENVDDKGTMDVSLSLVQRQ